MNDPDPIAISTPSLPRVLCSSVIRSVHKGESHGGVYLVDLQDGTAEQVIDWTDASIDWKGRGGDRGLRGIAFHGELIYFAASDEIFVYDRSFEQVGSFRNPYLKHCHEINVAGDRLYAASTGFDSVLEYDLTAQRFTRAWMLRYGPVAKAWSTKSLQLQTVSRLGIRPKPRFRTYDPNGNDGPTADDTTHLNNVWLQNGAVFACGTRLGTLWRIDGDRCSPYAAVPLETHNTRPFRDGVLYNYTRRDRIVEGDLRGGVRATIELPRHATEALEHTDIPGDYARAAFGRGLTVVDDAIVIGGSSPATITATELSTGEQLASVNITMDVRNAVHGLEVWPSGPPVGRTSMKD